LSEKEAQEILTIHDMDDNLGIDFFEFQSMLNLEPNFSYNEVDVSSLTSIIPPHLNPEHEGPVQTV